MNGFIKLTAENDEAVLVNIDLVQYVRQGKRFANVALQGKPDMLVKESARDVESIIKASYTGAIIAEELKPEAAQSGAAKSSPAGSKGSNKK
ncbi:hypothetical protein OO185_02550 [Prosthecochloris sp. SCSIO W1102]|uniref:hypothetical protein n=1 Tax=Prosthecochloris sp. SCSIO W1102 TaxID=2992243 RepID=UPI00223CA5E2|nr:hypothetical protein [Prosthecochloris sp. SCSIO W1102]UZJ40001.1 hypothetical protein OO185_02550 [Prosthecochloris sp. SCSIO W1102]